MLNTGHSYTVEDIQLLSQVILYNLLDPQGDRQMGAEYMKQYNLSVKDIEKLIKVDKLSDKYKKLYTSRQKTQLRNMFGHLEPKTIHSTTYNMSKTASKVEKAGNGKKSPDDDNGDGDGDDDSDEVVVCGKETGEDEDDDDDEGECSSNSEDPPMTLL
jgi:hypothetical protein